MDRRENKRTISIQKQIGITHMGNGIFFAAVGVLLATGLNHTYQEVALALVLVLLPLILGYLNNLLRLRVMGQLDPMDEMARNHYVIAKAKTHDCMIIFSILGIGAAVSAATFTKRTDLAIMLAIFAVLFCLLGLDQFLVFFLFRHYEKKGTEGAEKRVTDIWG